MPQIYGTPEWEEILTRVRNNDKTLTILDFKGHHIGDAGAQELAVALDSNNCITEFNLISLLGSNRIGPEGMRDLSLALKNRKNMTYFNMEYNEIKSLGAQNLGDVLRSNLTLTYLNLGSNNIGVSGAEDVILALKDNKSITHLDLGNNRIKDTGAALIGQLLKENNTLISLNLNQNRITDEGAFKLSQGIKENDTLTSLVLQSNEITSAGAHFLTEAVQYNHSLTFINMKYNPIKTPDIEVDELMHQVEENRIATMQRRDIFVQNLILLARDKENTQSQSHWSKLPIELMVYIIGFTAYQSSKSIGKSPIQIRLCSEFVLKNVEEMNYVLRKAIETKKLFKIIERTSQKKFLFIAK